MHIHTNITALPDSAKNHVVIIGNFDGVHRGHSALIDTAKTIAADLGAKIAVLTFEPHPRALFRPDERPFRLTTQAIKHERLKSCGVDTVFALNFDWGFASQSADDFINNILVNSLSAAHIIVGYDFRFGQMRKGAPDMIKAAGVPTTIIPAITDGAQVISSSAIRQAIRCGKIGAANALLDWDWEVRGQIEHGDRRGRELGYPTANFDLSDTHIHPAYGVYAARVQIQGEDMWRSAAINIGIRPMFETPKARIESYIFDFRGDIYGKTLRVRPVEHLRSEAKFDTLEALIAQMDKDCARAREILK